MKGTTGEYSPVVPFNAYANLQGYADGGPPNLRVNQDGVISYTLNPISNLSSSAYYQSASATYTREVAGTYSAAVFALGASQLDQDFELVDFQIVTDTYLLHGYYAYSIRVARPKRVFTQALRGIA